MAKYTWEDIIIDPTSDRAKEAVGKQVYYSQFPNGCLLKANNDDRFNQEILISIDPKNSLGSFIVNGNPYACIIVKKEEPKPKYVPFESKEEFIEAFHYHDNANYSETEDILMNYGMWLKDKNSHEIFLVTGVFNQSIHICDFDSDESWGELLNEFTFLDSSPCGKPMEE